MTSAIAPTLPGPTSAATPAASGTAGATNGAASAAVDFSGILLAMLPPAVCLPVTAGNGGESGSSGSKADKQAKPGDPETKQEKGGDTTPEDPTKTAPVVVIVTLPLFTPTTGAQAGDGAKKDEGSPAAGVVAAPVPDPTGLVETLPQTQAAPAGIAIPAGFTIADPTDKLPDPPSSGAASAAPDTAGAPGNAALPVPGAAGSAASAAPATVAAVPDLPDLQSKTVGNAGNAGLAFAARLTTSTASGQQSGRPPQMHLAVPPEAAGKAPVAEPEAAVAKVVAGAGSEKSGQTEGPFQAVPAAKAVDAAPRTPLPQDAETVVPDAQPAQTAAETGSSPEAARTDGAAARVEETPGIASAAVQQDRGRRGQESGADPGSGGADQRHPAESLFPTAVSQARSDATNSGRSESISRDHSPSPAASSGASETQPSRPETPVQPVRELSILVPGRVAANGRPGPDVEVRVAERTGEMHVTVRTSDPQLSSSLRENLPQMVSQLADRGYRAETWHPGAGAVEGGVVRTENAAAESGSGSGFRNSGRGGSDTPGQGGGRQGQRRDQENPPEWLEALERSMGRGDARTRSVL